ncbi:MAG: VWA domain-containing protein [Chloroflexota bacterium]
MFRFENPALLYALLALIPFAAVFAWYRFYRYRMLKRFSGSERTLYENVSPNKPYLRFALYSISFAALVVAAANPQIGSKLETRESVGGDIAIALDISNSMLAEDSKPTRLESAKQSLMKFLDELDGERVALVVFAGEAFLQMPLTSDYGAAKLLLSNASPDQISSQGTALAEAIEISLEALRPSEKESKAILIISDGENHEDDPLPAAENAEDEGVKIFAVSVGSREGAPVPEYVNGIKTGASLKSPSGEEAYSRPNKEILRSVAAATGGKLIDAGAGEADLSSVISALGRSKDKTKKTQVFTEFESIYYYFAAFAFALLVFEQLFSDRRNKLITTLNLFGSVKK